MRSYWFNLAEFSSRNAHTNFSDGAVQSLRNTISGSLGGTSEQIDDLMEALSVARRIALSLESGVEAKNVRENLKNTQRAISKLESSMSSWGIYEVSALNDLIDEDTKDKDLITFLHAYPNYGAITQEFSHVLSILDKAINNALSKLETKIGPHIKYTQRFLALFIKDALEVRGIKATSYDEGIYFQILATAFDDIFHEDQTEAHRRYGSWALSTESKDLNLNAIGGLD